MVPGMTAASEVETGTPRPTQRARRRKVTARQVRLAAGLVLFAYIVTHFLNHALGLIALEAMESGRALFLVLWRNPIATLLV